MIGFSESTMFPSKRCEKVVSNNGGHLLSVAYVIVNQKWMTNRVHGNVG